MKPLNRPMFKMGGPIKEGLMDGIREPKKKGGMLLVGEHPKEFRDASGREKHVAPIVYGAGLGLARLAPLAIRGARALQGLFGSRKFVKDVGTKLAPKTGGAQFTPVKEVFQPNRLAQYFIQSPEGRLIAGGSGLAGKVGRGVYKGGKYLASSPLAVGGGVIYVGGKFFKDGKEVPPPPGVGRQFTGDEAMVGDPRQPLPDSKIDSKQPSGVQLTDKEKRKQQIDKYRDIMDIKGMNKDAAYNSLIAASKAISESGDFKGDIKSGRLINQIIQGASKAFDKPKATKDAIDTLILKGEIEKDIKASDPSTKLLNEYRLKQMEKIDKDLETGFAEAKIAASKNLSGQNAIDAAASVASDNFKGNLVTKTQLTEVMEGAKKGGEISEQNIIIAAVTEVIKGKDIPDGDYTVGDALVTITKGQVTNIKR